MASLSQANNPTAFTRSAVEFNVAESDFLILESRGILTYEGFSLRVPSKEDLEEFLKSTIVPSSAFRDSDGVLPVFPRVPGESWSDYKISEDAAALRKLWLVGREISRSELERLATGDESAKGKIHIQPAIAMEHEAIKRGMPHSCGQGAGGTCCNLRVRGVGVLHLHGRRVGPHESQPHAEVQQGAGSSAQRIQGGVQGQEGRDRRWHR